MADRQMESSLLRAWRDYDISFVKHFSRLRAYKLALQYIASTKPSGKLEILQDLMAKQEYSHINRAAHLFYHIEELLQDGQDEYHNIQWLEQLAIMTLPEEEAESMIDVLDMGTCFYDMVDDHPVQPHAHRIRGTGSNK